MKKNDFLVVRHSYDDHSYIDGENDIGESHIAEALMYRISDKNEARGAM